MRKLSSSRADLVLLLLGSLNGLKWLKTRQEPMRKCRWECNKTPAHSKHWQMWLQLLWPNKWVWFARSTYYLRGVNLKTKDSVCMWKAVHRYFIRAHWQGSTKEVNPTPSRVVCPSTVADRHSLGWYSTSLSLRGGRRGEKAAREWLFPPSPPSNSVRVPGGSIF